MITDIRKFFLESEKSAEESSKIPKSPGSKDPKKSPMTQVQEKVKPVIVTFQNGELIDGSDFNVKLTANKNGSTNVCIETSNGHIYKESSKTEKPTEKQTILVRNKKTNKVRLIEVDSALLINSALLTTPETRQTEVDFAKEFRTLNKTFGGKRIVARLEQREKLNLSSLPIADDVKKALEDIKVEENVSTNDTETESITHLLPPCHRDSAVLSEVYKIEEILSEEEMQVLKNEISAMDEVKFNPQSYSQFFMSCYVEAKKSKENLDTRLAGILFAETLIKFLKIASKKLQAKNVVLCPFSPVINDRLVNDFCIKTENSITRPITMRDKSLCYIIAVSLISCNYKIDLKLLSVSTAEHLKKLIRLARAVGAVPVAKQENVFILKLPLPALPKATPGRARKK